MSEPRLNPAEIAERARLVRQATEAAWARGLVAPSAEDLTAVLGDTAGMCRAELGRSRGVRRRSERTDRSQGRMPRSG